MKNLLYKRIYTKEIGEKLAKSKVSDIITPILMQLSALKYKNEILENYNINRKTRNKNERFSLTIQLKTIILNTLKNNAFPVVLSDLTKNLDEKRKILRYNFLYYKYTLPSNIYIKNLYNRIVSHLSDHNYTVKRGITEEIIENVKKSKNIVEHILLYILMDDFNYYTFNKYKLNVFTSYGSLYNYTKHNVE